MDTHFELSNRMFLSSELEKVVARIQLAHAKSFDFAWRLNELAHQALFGTKADPQHLQQLLLVTLEHRALTSYQGVVLLAERGLPSEAQVVLRTLLEVTFRIVAIAKNEDVGRAYVLEDQLHRRKFINKYKLLDEELRTEVSEAVLNDLKAAIDQKINDQEIKELKIQWFAKRAGLESFYNSAYAVLSESVHVNSRSLQSALSLDDDDNLVALDYGPNDRDLDDHIYTAAEALFLSLRAVYSVIDTDYASQIEQLHEELKRDYHTS